jgi:hypothetical protein
VRGIFHAIEVPAVHFSIARLLIAVPSIVYATVAVRLCRTC